MHDTTGQAQRRQRTTVHQGRIIAVHVDDVELPNGRSTRLDVIDHPGATAIVPIDSDEHVWLVRQLRYPTQTWLLEVPAGTLDANEAPELCARRELEEETGQSAQELVALGHIWTTPGFTNERIWLYLARGLTPCPQRLDADEILNVERLPFTDCFRLAQTGEISDAKSICALMRAHAFLQTERG